MHDAGSKIQSRSQQPPSASHALDAGRQRFEVAGRVSVIVPAYNAGATIERTISSVLIQTYTDLEVLVVDDGSTDATGALVQRMADMDPRVRLLRKTNGGLVSARNHGIAHASGEFIAPVDADDVWHPEKIGKQVALMRERGDQVGLIYTWARGIDEQDRVLFDISPCSFRGDVYTALIIRSFVGSGAPLVRRRCVEEVGGYDATLAGRGATCCEDLKFSLDIAERCRFDFVPEFLWAHRFRAGSMSTDIDAMLRSHEVVAREARARHPELPDKLFRWASAHQFREFGFAHLGDGHCPAGARLLLKALVRDPVATLRTGVPRAFARLRRSSRLSKLVGANAHDGAGGGIVKRKFLEVDPTVSCGRQAPQWSQKRLAYIAGLRVEPGPEVRFATRRT